MIMSVYPGWAGQPFIPEVLPKVQKVRQELERRGLRADVELDGGISTANARRALDAGANVLVAASAIFQASDVAAAARALAELTSAESQSGTRPRAGEEVRDAGDDPRRG
jgi:ribulose-phosphate 3-epimerase